MNVRYKPEALLLLVYLGYVLWMGAYDCAFWLVLACVLHELTHILVGKFYGCKTRRLTFGLLITVGIEKPANRRLNAIIALAAPFVNFLLIFVAGFFHLFLFAAANLLLLAFNLLPIPGTDLWTAIRPFFGKNKFEVLELGYHRNRNRH